MSRQQVADAWDVLLPCGDVQIESPRLGILATLHYRHCMTELSDYS